MNEIWEVLGIAPTSDKRAIRSAYSGLAKECHPEEDPQGFKKLHEAYQAAMEYAAKNRGQTGNITSSVYGDKNREEAGNEAPYVMPSEICGNILPKDRDDLLQGTKGEKAWKEKEKEKEQGGLDVPSDLLSRLAKAKEEELSQSMHSGALMQFSAILNDPKKFRKAEVWKAFFLSEDFLREQYQESFADGMFQILQDFHTEDNFNIVQMPSGFLMELAIAYALVLNSRQSEERAANFYAREVAASVWNMQQTEYSLPIRLLLKPENQVRMRSFDDYMRLKNYNSRGLLTRQNQEDWKGLLRGGAANYLYELKGRGGQEIYPETRSVCLLELYIFWIKMEEVPKCILEYMYGEYNLRGAEHTSTKRYYEPLKQAILAQYPDIEEALYGKEGRAKLISAWYRAMMQIISDSECFYEETEQIKERVRALFEREEWLKIRYLPELFTKMELQLLGRSVMPASLARRLMEHYSDGTGITEQAWEKEQGEVMTEEMIHSLYYSRMIMDMHGAVPDVTPYFRDGKFWEVHKGKGENSGYPDVLNNQDFWHYFLMRGFGCRSARITGRGKYRRKYIVGGKAFLPAYIEYLYQPSVRWQKLFTGVGREGAIKLSLRKDAAEKGGSLAGSGYGEEQSAAEKTLIPGKIPVPGFCGFSADGSGEIFPETEFTLPDGKRFRAEFHLHYVRYFLDDKEIFRPIYSFKEFKEISKFITDTKQLIFLLAITKISREDYETAEEMIGHLLWDLPLAPVSIPLIARLLAAGEEESAGGKVLAAPSLSLASLEMAAKSAGYVENKYDEEKIENLFGNMVETEESRIMGIYYVEDEELCFRAVVEEGGFAIFRQTGLGWEQIHTAVFPSGKKMLLAEEKRRAVQEFLQGLGRPAPILRESLSLEGMTNVEKAQRILEALKQDALYRGREHALLPYALGYLWEEDNMALQYFYNEYGGYLPEGYCVLRFGKDDMQDRKEHVFYCSMKPFGFALALRSSDWPSSYKYREKELHQKVKEKHWVVGHFGWGDLIGPGGEAVPKMIAVGESGTYYYYDVVRLLRQESLAALLAKMFDFSNVIAVENYEGELSISRFSGELEYCYGREVFLQSIYTAEKTAADLFTVFTKAELIREFGAFMDGLLEEIIEKLDNLYFEFSYVGNGGYAMQVFSQDIMQQKQTLRVLGDNDVSVDCPVWEELMKGRKPLVWKIWQQVGNGAQMSRDFKDAMYWYMECGKFGKKLAGWKKITASFDLGKGDELVVRLSYKEKEGWEWHRNRMEEQKENWREYFEEDFKEEDFSKEDLE